ncbi:hypothetical protein DPV79_23555 [Burkholderia reimsis]|uniref:Uncharacterized protein n=1 Tax=Burkholderia reimsis TaxID=2234132 RepID=A0A365QRB7_9BURK|nr:hypothetical protein [Burkholderia reimsis]RBB36979.1 hypothetical protein DPV79_23555 [Burkholderia reimsis]
MSKQALLEALRDLEQREAPDTATAQIRQIEPEITALLDKGFTLRKIWTRLGEERLQLSFNGFKSAYYRARDAANAARNDSGPAKAQSTIRGAGTGEPYLSVGANLDRGFGRGDVSQTGDVDTRFEMKPSKTFPNDDSIQIADLPTEIARVRDTLRFPFDLRGSGMAFEAYMRRVNAWLEARTNRDDSGEAQQIETGLIADYPRGPEDVPDEEHRGYLFEAFQFLARAERAAKLGVCEEAWFFLSSARFCLGKADGHYAVAHARMTHSKRASKGGVTRVVKLYEKTRSECARLLKDLRPDTGWRTRDDAIKAVLPELEAPLKKQGNPFGDVYALVSTWLNRAGEIRDAYQNAAK